MGNERLSHVHREWDAMADQQYVLCIQCPRRGARATPALHSIYALRVYT